MSVGSKQTTEQKTDPAQLAMLTANYNGAKPIAAGLSQPYTGQLVAHNSPGQIAAQGAYTSIANNNVGQPALDSAVKSTSGFLNFDPTANISKFMNPFTDSVIKSSLGDLERQRQIAGVSDNQRATASHAFGGSRQGVADSLTNQAYDQNAAGMIAGLRNTGYNTALGASQAAANTSLAASGQLAQQSQQQLDQAGQRAGFLSQVGDAQQAQQQAQLTAQYQEFLRQLAGSEQGQQLLNSTLGIFPQQGTTTTTGQQSMLPGIIGAIGGIGGGLLSSNAAGAAIFGKK